MNNTQPTISVQAYDRYGFKGSTSFGVSSIFSGASGSEMSAQSATTFTSIAGSDRYETAIKASQDAFAAGSATTVVIARGDMFADALGGSALAGAVNGPLLLTSSSSVPASVITELKRLGATKVYVLGGTSAVSAAAYKQLAAFNPERVSGSDRYGTALAVANKTIGLLGSGYSGAAFMATGSNFPDALSAAPIAYAKGMPLVLVKADGSYTLPAGVTKVEILGGTAVVSTKTQISLGSKFDRRLAGGNRYATSAAVAAYGVSQGLDWDGVGIATGTDSADALAGGAMLGAENSVMLLTAGTSLSPEAASALKANKAAISAVRFIGGTSAVSTACRNSVMAIFDVAPVTSDTTAPVTTLVGAFPPYPQQSSFWLSAADSGSGVAHTYYILDGGPQTEGAWVIDYFNIGTHTLEYWSVDKAGNTEAHHTITSTVVSYHAAPANSCTAAGCHSTDLATIHIAKGCTMCHGAGVTPKSDCTACHSATPHATHVAISSSATGTASCSQSTCHGAAAGDTDVVVIHGGNCAICHSPSASQSVQNAVASGNATCESCHTDSYNTIHAAASQAHGFTGACATSGCHPTDVSVIHTWTTTDSAPGCAACHAVGKTPSLTCTDCHSYSQMDAAHGYSHTTVQTSIASKSAGCVSCHGSDLLSVLPAGNAATGVKEHKGCYCHVYGEAKTGITACEDCHGQPMDASAAHPYHVGAHDAEESHIASSTSAACAACHGTDLSNVLPAGNSVTGVQEHKGCSCHAYGEANGLKACADCHAGQYAPHGFDKTAAKPIVSGHSTTTYGKAGAFTMFDGSQGVTATDSLGSIVATAWPFPQQNVFWTSSDASAPVGAITGLNQNSVVTCEDCHTGLRAYEVAGPHGANVIAAAGIDANFAGGFDNAYLWSQDTSTTSGNPSLDGTPTSGIGLYVPKGGESEEMTDYYLGDGSGHVYNGNSVICAKCHDLYNAGTGDIGWSNYAHEHHANRPMVGATNLGREGAGACRDCHIAIPHGWVRPRLIVYSTDAAPYNIGPSVYEGESKTATTGVTIGSGQMNGLSSIKGPQSIQNLTNGTGYYNNWSTSQCNACGHHASTDLSTGAWK